MQPNQRMRRIRSMCKDPRRPDARLEATSSTSASPLRMRWQTQAKEFRGWGATAQADVLERCAAELEEFERERELEALTLEQAGKESGYSYSALEKMVRRG